MLNDRDVEKSYEDACITLELVESFAGLVIDKLKDWANKEIFDGGLEVEIPLDEAVNAGAVSFPGNPKKAKIIITMAMLFEIYRDGMAFPMYAEKCKRDTNTFGEHLWRKFDSVPFKFSGGVPDLEDNELTAIGQFLVSAWKSASTRMAGVDEEHKQMLSRSLACRFQMFEFMIAWVFFHELSHIVQCHYKLKPGPNGNGELYELNSDSLGSYSSQAREILADIEGLDLTLRYLFREGVYNYKSFYYLLCAQTCMFNRFYSGKYDENYFSVKTTHPHPVVRYEFVCNYFSSRLNNEVPLVFNDE